MKHMNKIFLTALLPLLAGCSLSKLYIPKTPYPGADPEVIEREPLLIEFYLDYNHSDEPIYTMDWYLLTPLGECPAEAVLTDANAADPLYPTFIGYSIYSSALDEDNIWNFETDYAQQGPLLLYGIWVAK